MSRIAYVNGRYMPHRDARVSIEDRGYQFADGVYEVMEVRRGGLVDEALHLERLARSLGELKMTSPLADAALALVVREIVRRNGIADGMVYLQVTRGVAPRDHVFPDPAPRPAARRKLGRRGGSAATVEGARTWRATGLCGIPTFEHCSEHDGFRQFN